MTTNPARTAPRLSTDDDTAPVVMPTLRGWENKIREHPAPYASWPAVKTLSKGQVQRIALKIHKRAARMQFVDPEDLIRYVLTYKDPTGEEAVGYKKSPRPWPASRT